MKILVTFKDGQTIDIQTRGARIDTINQILQIPNGAKIVSITPSGLKPIGIQGPIRVSETMDIFFRDD